MNTLHVSTLINFAKEAGDKEKDVNYAARAFCCYLIGHISYYDQAQARELANALHLRHAMNLIEEDDNE